MTRQRRYWQKIKDDPVVKAAANKRAKAWYEANKHKTLARHSRDWRERPDVRRRKQSQNLQTLYGITLEQKEALLQQQGMRCAICRDDDVKSWHVDHCHETKVVRGILCNNCNLMIGHAKEEIGRLIGAAIYLSGKRS